MLVAPFSHMLCPSTSHSRGIETDKSHNNVEGLPFYRRRHDQTIDVENPKQYQLKPWRSKKTGHDHVNPDGEASKLMQYSLPPTN